jgi:hypothetical protein
MIIQVIGAVIILMALFMLFEHVRRRGVDIYIGFLFIVFLVLLVIVITPQDIAGFLTFGFTRPLDAFLTITAVSALFLCVIIYFSQREINKNITELVRKKALEEKK